MKRMFGKKDKNKSSPRSEAAVTELPTTINTAAAAATDNITTTSSTADDSTVLQSGNSLQKKMSKKQRETRSLEQQLAAAKEQIATEKAGKRKLFHSLVKLANELRRTRDNAGPLMARQAYAERTWYEGGMWRAPQVLPGIYGSTRPTTGGGGAAAAAAQDQPTMVAGGLSSSAQAAQQFRSGAPAAGSSTGDLSSSSAGAAAVAAAAGPPGIAHRTTRIREAISLSDLFFNLVIVTGFTRVGITISQLGTVDLARFFYFAIFWSVWNKEASYSTRFDTTDLSAQLVVLVTCFAVLFASLSTAAPLDSVDANRIMIMAAGVAALYCGLHVRVLLHNKHSSTTTLPPPAAGSPGAQHSRVQSSLARHVRNYAVYQIIATALECSVWLVGIIVQPVSWKYRWVVFVLALCLGLRIPRAFLANDFHAACSKRGVLFILLLGFLLQSIVVVASEFFEYQTPTLEHYYFIGAACLMLFCIKLLYVDDSDTLAQDHALLVNRWAGFFFNVGQFTLLLSTTVMGSGLNLLTHAFLAATAALPGPEKTLVCGGFSATLLSTFFIKSMHLKRVPTDPRNQALFVAAYVIQTVVLLVVVIITAAMCLNNGGVGDWSSLFIGGAGGFFNYLMQTDSQLLYSLSGAALFVVLMSWLDEGVELTLYESAEDSRAFRVHPFGIWWCCLRPEVDQAILETANAAEIGDDSEQKAKRSLSVLSPLLGSSMAEKLKEYDATTRSAKRHGSNEV